MYTNMICTCFQADPDTDEVYAQMTLKPVTSESVFSLLFLPNTYLDIPSVQVCLHSLFVFDWLVFMISMERRHYSSQS
jgi:hypothetical protein